MSLIFDFNNVMEEAIGTQEGLAHKALAQAGKEAKLAHSEVWENRGKGWQEWCELPQYDKEQLAQILDYGKQVRKSCDSFVVLGIGGSALGALSVCNALLHLRHNELPKSKRKAPKLYIEDNVDPERMAALLDVLDLRKTVFNVITKSGETSETLSQFLILYARLKEVLGEDAKNKIVVTTTIGKGTLYDIAVKEGFKIFPVGKGVGGRFSVLSAVGLVPFAVMGIDVKKLLKGANDMSKKAAKPDIFANPALMSAVVQHEYMKRGKNISVMMPYADGLKYVSDFYCQLWGESLGKAVDVEGNVVNVGQTPVKAVGVTDQHSQIQLYCEGPFDKVVTLIGVQSFRQDVTIPHMDGAQNTVFLQGRSLQELINAERVATAFALTKANRANFSILLDTINEYNVGALLQYFMYQTAFCGALLRVDTFNQPGVEEGKLATFAMLNRKGYEQKLSEINSLVPNPKYIINI